MEQLNEGTPPYVLIVDDSPETLDALVRLLRFEGFRAESTTDPLRALEMISLEQPDVILLDVMMPVMDGLQVLEIIRQQPLTAEIPVIMLTALGDPHDVVEGLERGANDYLTKPPQFEILAARLRTQVKLKRLQDQRRQDIKRLRELDAMKDKFLQIAAHDLKNPINNIMMGIEVLHRVLRPPDAPPEYDNVLDMIRGAADMMRVIVSDFLDLQAIQAGQFELELHDTSLNTILSGVIRQFKPYADSKGVTLRVELDPAMPQCRADPDRLAQVISNLVSNAIKFSPTGATVLARTRTTGDRLIVEVLDNGPGIPEEEMPMLFQEFARLSNKPTGGERSSGVGLSIARRLVELHGGVINAKSKVGHGSLFWFELPAP
jgi:two-component system sensor histidine kinase/response regulator